MSKKRFWVTILGSISEKDGLKLWKKIQHGKDINLLVLEEEAHVYGKTTEDVLSDVISQCLKTGHLIQFHTE